MKKAKILFYSLIICTSVLAQTSLPPENGDGSEQNPYEINCIENLYWLKINTAQLDKYFIQTADISAAATHEWNAGEGFHPIGVASNSFRGSYDGNGYVIDGLSINLPGSTAVALFGHCTDATIKNVALTQVDITGDKAVGSLVGAAFGNTHVTNSYATGEVKGTESVGGFVGSISTNAVHIEGCYSHCKVTGNNKVGGFAGFNSAKITNSYCTGDVTGNFLVAGFSAYNNAGTISGCYSNNEVRGDSLIAGFTAYNYYSTISNSYSRGSYVIFPGERFSDPDVDTLNSGGFCGINQYSTIENVLSFGGVYYFYSYSIPFVGSYYVYSPVNPGKKFVAHEIGDNSYLNNFVSYLNNFVPVNDEDTLCIGATLISVPEANDTLTFVNAGWNFDTVWFKSSHIASDGVIHLQWEEAIPYIKKAPAYANDNYLVTNLDDLQWILEDTSRWEYNYILANSINASETEKWNGNWKQLGTLEKEFTGNFNGMNHTIDSIIYSDGNYPSFFGYVKNANISNIRLHHAGVLIRECDSSHIENCRVNINRLTSFNNFGALIGKANDSQISYSSSSGLLKGGSFVGGLVGRNNNSELMNCFSTAQVNGSTNIGGLTALNSGLIEYCFYEGQLEGLATIGGLVGVNDYDAEISLSYANAEIKIFQGSGMPPPEPMNYGGFVAINQYGSITNAYSRGSIARFVSGAEICGGFVGDFQGGNIENCYTATTINSFDQLGGFAGKNTNGIFSHCFWDVQVSEINDAVGNGNSDNVSGKTSSQMKSIATFTASGWDFIDETENGTEDFWFTSENFNLAYPDIIYPINYKGNISVLNKVYDGNTAAQVNTHDIDFTGHHHEHDLSVDSLILNFSDKTVELDKDVVLKGIVLNEPFYEKYKITITDSICTQADITEKELFITGSFQVSDKEYDGTDQATINQNNLELSGVVVADLVDLINVEVAFSQVNVGENVEVTITSADLSGQDKKNYVLSLVNSPTALANIQTPTGIENLTNKKEDIILYPNPCYDIVFFNNPDLITAVSLYNTKGQLILTENKVDHGINIAALHPGEYILIIQTNAGKKTGEILLKK